MANGFATGLVHGTLVCGAALVALSLALPQPPRPMAAVEAKASLPAPLAAPASAPVPKPVMAAPAAPPPAAPPPAAPKAEDLPLPEGSGFAQVADMQPRAPAALRASAAAPAVAPAISRPADEAAPARPDPAGLRPEAPNDAPATPRIAAPAIEPPNLPAPATSAPVALLSPDRIAAPGPDRTPDRRTVTAALAPPRPAASAGPDLSTPPDFGALRLTAQEP